MPRPPRVVIEGYPHHVILRGNNKSAIFYADKDRRFFITCLKEAKEKTNSKVYAYCLMTNHAHLIIEPSTIEGLARLIQSLGRRYVQYINKSYKRTGTLWEGRFKSSVISKDKYLLTCIRYIELNPVRAKVVQRPEDYPWSSFGFRAEGRHDSLLDRDPVYNGLSKTDKERQLRYKKWFLQTISDEELYFIRSTTQKGGVICCKESVTKISKLIGRDVVLKERGRPKK